MRYTYRVKVACWNGTTIETRPIIDTNELGGDIVAAIKLVFDTYDIKQKDILSVFATPDVPV